MLAPSETFRLLKEHHLPSLTTAQQRLLAARVLGYSVREIAVARYLTERTVRDQLETLMAAICLPLGLEHRELGLTGLWFGHHLSCDRSCLAEALLLIDRDALFDCQS